VTRRLSIPGSVLALLFAAISLPAYAAANDGSVSGMVRDAKGTPQIGALV